MKVYSQLERAQFEIRTVAPSNPALGMVYYDSTTRELRVWDGTMWQTPGCPVGTITPYFGSTAPAGWLLLNGQTIGTVSSGANSTGSSLLGLYTLLWNETTGDTSLLKIYTSAGAETTRGSTALADFNANKRLALPNAAGRALVGAGTGSGLTNRVLGSLFGDETITLGSTHIPKHDHSPGADGKTGDDTPDHTHTYVYRVDGPWGTLNSGGPPGYVTNTGNSVPTGAGSKHRHPLNSFGGKVDGTTEAHANIQPSLATYYIIKF